MVLSYYPERTSVKTIIHFLQIIKAGLFQQFDYGDEQNLFVYNQSKPPIYPLNAINVPVHLFYGLDDLFVSYEVT